MANEQKYSVYIVGMVLGNITCPGKYNFLNLCNYRAGWQEKFPT